jgi:hypothetical protein
MLAQRIPILPEMPCELTRMQWPEVCADGRPPLSHEPWFAYQAYRLDRWHCAYNPRVCRDCLFARVFSGNLDSFVTLGGAFQTRFPDPHGATRVDLQGKGVRMGFSLTAVRRPTACLSPLFVAPRADSTRSKTGQPSSYTVDLRRASPAARTHGIATGRSPLVAKSHPRGTHR